MAKLSSDKIDRFRPQLRNSNKHTQRGTGMLEASMRKYGYVSPMTAAADGEIIDGSARIETSAGVFGDDVIVVHHDGTKPVIMVRDDIASADTPEAREISIAANRIAQVNLDFDAEALLGDLQAGVDLAQFWRKDELDELLADLQPKTTGDTPAEVDRAEELRQKWGVVSGQLWQLGEHRLVCGDCTDLTTVARVMGGDVAAMVQTDPPYGVDYSGQTESMFYGTDKPGRSRARIDGDMTPQDAEVLTARALSEHIAPLLFLWCAPQYHDIAKRCAAQAGYTVFSVIVWNKNHANFGAMGARYKPKYEMALACKRDKIPWYGPDNEVTVWDIDRAAVNDLHPTQKPVPLFERAISNHTQAGAIVYEPFSGSGTTIIACENLARRCRACEISPAYVAVALERWSVHTGRQPVLVDI